MSDEAIPEFDSDIDRRVGWPDELRVLLKEYPRASWQQNATPLTRFWIDKHNHLRNQSSALQSAIDNYREQRNAPAEFGVRVVPRLQSFLSQLHGHHQIEDFHYFPAFRAADRRLNPGLNVLARDHELLHESIVSIFEAMNVFIDTIREATQSSVDEQRHAGDGLIEASEPLYRRLGRHLDDEEDLIIPIILAKR